MFHMKNPVGFYAGIPAHVMSGGNMRVELTTSGFAVVFSDGRGSVYSFDVKGVTYSRLKTIVKTVPEYEYEESSHCEFELLMSARDLYISVHNESECQTLLHVAYDGDVTEVTLKDVSRGESEPDSNCLFVHDGDLPFNIKSKFCSPEFRVSLDEEIRKASREGEGVFSEVVFPLTDGGSVNFSSEGGFAVNCYRVGHVASKLTFDTREDKCFLFMNGFDFKADKGKRFTVRKN